MDENIVKLQKIRGKIDDMLRGEKTVIMRCAKYNWVECFDFWVKHGEDINFCDEDNWTALHEAVEYGNYESCEKLIELGANVDIQTKVLLETPLMLVIKKRNMKIFKLLAPLSDLSIKGLRDETAIHKAIIFGGIEYVCILASYGADINAQTRHGYTILMFSVMEDKSDCFDFIINCNPDINLINYEGKTALELVDKRDTKNKEYYKHVLRQMNSE